MKKFRNVFVHAGFDKTGSTSIQKAFARSRDALAQQGFLYPDGDWHAQLGSYFCSQPETYIFNELLGQVDLSLIRQLDADYLDAFSAGVEASSATQMAVSYEGFASIDEEGLVRFREYLARYADEVIFIVYCRPPLSYAVSALSQRARSGIPPWIDVPIVPFRDVLAKLGRVAGHENLVVRAYQGPASATWNVVADICALLALPDLSAAEYTATPEVPVNPSLSREGYLIATKLIELSRDRMQFEYEPSQSFSAVLGAIAGDRLVLTSEQARSVMDQAEDHLAYLREVHRLQFAEERGLISDTPCSLGEKTAASIAAELFRLLLPQPDKTHDVKTGDLKLHAGRLREGPRIFQGQAMTFDVDFILKRKIPDLSAGIHIHDRQGRNAFAVNSKLLGRTFGSLPPGSYRATHHLAADLPLGTYMAGFAFDEELPDGRTTLAWRRCLCQFDVVKAEERASHGYAALASSIELQPSPLALDANVVRSASGRLRILGEAPRQLASMVLAEIPVEVENLSEQDWLGDTLRPVYLAYHWRDTAGQIVVFEGLRSPLPQGKIGKGETIRASVVVEPPVAPGNYTLQITLLQEHLAWFEAMGFSPANIEVEVR